LSNNFFVYRKDRQTRRGGGVLIGVKSNLTSEFVDISESSGIKFISVKLSFPKRKIFFICSYISPGSEFNVYLLHLSAIHSISLLLETDQLIVLGDFNLPNISWLESKDSLAMIPRMQNDFIDGLVELSLQQVNRIPNHIGRLLDLIFVFDSSDAEVSRISPLSLPEDCYHPTLQLCINGFFNNPRTAINVQSSLCFKRTDYGRLVES